MEPITHFLTGACIGRAGLNRKTAYATVAAVLAAEAGDLDMLWAVAGPVEELKHHRGITHTFLAAPLVAGVVVGGIWLWHFWRERRLARRANTLNQDTKAPPATAAIGRQPVHWGWLYLTALLAALSHLLLDWTNNYGVRPFFPFNPRWYAGSIVFIVEPVLWGLFAVALVLPWLFGLADSEIGARRKPFRGQGWAIFALAGMVVLWCVRWAEQAQARAMLENVQVTAAPVTRTALEPYMVNPFRWHAILETADLYQTGEVDTRSGEILSDPVRNTLYKPTDTPAVEAAKRTPLGQVYLDWGSWAVVRDLGQQPMAALPPPNLPPGRQWTTIEFSDLRFAYSLMGTPSNARRSPLGGWVYIVDGRQDAGEGMGGRQQK
jgi:inner membrane protein